jgi:hypothetical protein
MKKNLFALIAASAALCIDFQSANASLIGMPLNLKAAIQISDVDAPSTACQFYTDDVLTGTLSVKGCWRA